MKIALIAHDGKKADMVHFLSGSKQALEGITLVATGTTGTHIEKAGFEVEKLLDIPEGFDLEIGIQGIKNEIVQSAHFVTKTDKDEKIYTSSFMLDYYMEG